MNPSPRSPRVPLLRACLLALPASLIFPLAQTIRAADGTWNTATSGLWSDSANWSGGTVADGSGFTADFSTLDIPAGATTVNLDSARTMGTLVFGDTATGTAGSWILANNSTPANILTLGGAATITVNAMASGTASTAPNVTISAVISGSNGLVKNGTGANTQTTVSNVTGTGTLTLSGANTYTGATDIQTGTIVAKNGAAFGTSTVTVESSGRLVLGTTSAIANTVNLNGTNALAVAGVGATATLSGTVNLQSNSSVWVTNVGGNNALSFSAAGSLNLGNNVLSISTAGSSNTATIAGTLTGGATSGIIISGGGPVTISGDGSGYSGTTTVGAATLTLGSDTASGTGVLAFTPGNNNTVTVRSSGAVGTTRTVAAAVTFDNSTSPTFTFGSATTGNLTFTNTGAVTLNSSRTFNVLNTQTEFDASFAGAGGIATKASTSTGTLVLNGANTYTGATTINAGTVQLGNGGTTGSLSVSSAISVASGAALAVKRSNAVVQGTDFATLISGAGGFTQAGSGVTTMAAGNTYTGTTTVSAGTLALGANNVFAVSNFSLGGGTTLAVGTFTNTAVGTLALTGNATITLGAGGVFAFADSHLLDWGGNMLSITGTFVDGSSIRFGSDASALTGAQLALISINGGAASINSSGYLVASAIPEPATCAMIAGVALLGAACWRRRHGCA